MCLGFVVHVTAKTQRDATPGSMEYSSKSKGTKAAETIAAFYTGSSDSHGAVTSVSKFMSRCQCRLLPETSDVLFKFDFIFYYFLRQRQANRQIDETVFFLEFLYYT